MQSQDFQNMQAQAISYAQEMFRKSSQPRQNEFQNEKKQNESERKSTYSESLFRNNIFGTNNIFRQNSNTGSNENDFSLILALILLLSKDSGDRILIMALLYIMS